MPWLQVRLAITPEQAETYEDALLEVGAVSVTFMDAEDQPIFEPDLGTTPLWSHTHLLALFEADTDETALLAHLQLLCGGALPEHQVERIEDQDWERSWMDNFQPMRFGRRLWIVPSWHAAPEPQANQHTRVFDVKDVKDSEQMCIRDRVKRDSFELEPTNAPEPAPRQSDEPLAAASPAVSAVEREQPQEPRIGALDAADAEDDQPHDEPEPDDAARSEPALREERLFDLDDEPLQLDWQQQKETAWGRLFGWGLLNLLAAAGLLAQYAAYNFDELARQDRYRPWFEQLCPNIGCELPSKVDISQIRSSNLVVRSHPEFSGALIVDAILYNRAPFAQPFPLLEMRFADLGGQL
ncbi:UNVERIFIED_CONTAM: prmA, partial [Trichonephila clavipes]